MDHCNWGFEKIHYLYKILMPKVTLKVLKVDVLKNSDILKENEGYSDPEESLFGESSCSKSHHSKNQSLSLLY